MVIGVLVIVFLEKRWRKCWYDFFFIVSSVLLARGLVTPVIRLFYHRDRPFLAMPETVIKLIEKGNEASFPSGHAILFFAMAMAIYYVRPKFAAYFFIAATLVSIARVFVGVHYPLDILGGALLGLAAPRCIKLSPSCRKRRCRYHIRI